MPAGGRACTPGRFFGYAWIMPAITTIIFDWGGVLIDDPAPLLLKVLTRSLGVTSAAFTAAMSRHAEAFQKGTCTERDFWNRICTELGVSAPAVPCLWGQAFRQVYRPKPQVWELAEALRRMGLKTALLSNTELPAVEYFRAAQPHSFDQLIFSCCEGCRKPEGRIFQIALDRLRSRGHETIFIDDNEHYLSGAHSLGMHTILFKSPQALRQSLAALLPAVAAHLPLPEDAA